MPGETRESKDARPAKPASGAKRAFGVTGGFNRSSLRALTTLGVLALAFLLFLVGAVGYWRMNVAVDDLERAQYGRLASDVRARIEHLVSRDRSRLKEAGFSDELYALVERGPAPPDSFIHPSFTELFPRLYGDQFVAIYDLGGKRLYGWSDGQHAVEAAVVTNPLLRVLDNREPAAGLVRKGDELYWVAGVPILPTNYGDAAHPIRGYLVVGHSFTGPAVSGLVADRSVELSLKPMEPRKTPFRSEVSPAAKGDSAMVRFALSDVFAQQNTLGEVVTSRAEFRAVERSYHWAAAVGLVLLAGLAGLGWWAAQRWVVEPAVRMNQALQPVHQGQVPPMVGSPLPATEWTAITASVNRLVANVRSGHERLDRFMGAVRDGAWEQDLASGDWVMSSRFRELLGYSEAELPATLTAFEQLIHPDDREYVLVTMQASSGSGRPLDVEARLRRRSGEYGSYRLTATVQTDHNGTPLRFTGKLVDQSSERAASVAVASAEEATARSKRALGRLLARIGQEVGAHQPDRGATISALGEAMAGSLGRAVGTFDLPQLIQEVAARSPVPADVAILAGVETRVSGDAERIRRILAELVSNAARATQTARIGIRVEHRAGSPAGYLRFTVADHGAALTSRDQQRLTTPLATGLVPPDGTPGVGLPLVRELVDAEAGTAGADFPGDGGARVWFELSLPPAEREEYRATAIPDAAAETAAFWTAPEAGATFDLPADRPSEPRISAPRERISSPRFELVADETVMIDLDGDEPVRRRSSDPKPPAIVAQLEAGGQAGHLAGQMATIFLKDAPIRLAELKGAVRAGESTTIASIAISLKGMATLIGAATLADRCSALEAAAADGDLGRTTDFTRATEQELDRIKPMLERFAGPARAPAAEPAIDPATLEQIRASLSGDGLGLGAQLVQLFLAEAPGKLVGIEQAAAGTDSAAVASAAADLKGMCGLIGAGPLGATCDRLGSAQSPTDRQTAIAAIRAELARVQQVLEEVLGAGTGA